MSLPTLYPLITLLFLLFAWGRPIQAQEAYPEPEVEPTPITLENGPTPEFYPEPAVPATGAPEEALPLEPVFEASPQPPPGLPGVDDFESLPPAIGTDRAGAPDQPAGAEPSRLSLSDPILGRIFLWIAFLAGMLIFSTAVLWSIFLFTRFRNK